MDIFETIRKHSIFSEEATRGFLQKGVFNNITKFIGKHMCLSLFLNKVADTRPANLLIKRL